MSLGSKYLVLLAPHRKVTLKFECAYASTARTFSAMGFLMTDLLLLCRRTDSGLQAWMLAPIQDLVTGDDALDNEVDERATDAAFVIGKPTTEYMLQLKVFPGWGKRQHRAGGSAYLASWVDRAPATPEDLPNLPLSRRSSRGERVVEGEPFRLELQSAEALQHVRKHLEETIEAARKAEVDAHRPDRRLRTGLEDGTIALCTELKTMRTRGDAKFRDDLRRLEARQRKALAAGDRPRFRASFTRPCSALLRTSSTSSDATVDAAAAAAAEQTTSAGPNASASATPEPPRWASTVRAQGTSQPSPVRTSFRELFSGRLSHSPTDTEETTGRPLVRRDSSVDAVKSLVSRLAGSQPRGPAAPPRGGNGWEVFC